jgi:hypothetical protein
MKGKKSNFMYIISILSISTLMILPSVSSVTSVDMADVEIYIGAGYKGKNIGYGLYFRVINHKLESINSNYKIEYNSFSNELIREVTDDLYIVEPGDSTNCIIFIFFNNYPLCSICKVNITLNADSYTVSRNGMKIGQFFILI